MTIQPITDVKLFKDESLQRMLFNIGRVRVSNGTLRGIDLSQIVSKVDRAESRIHFIGSGYLAGGERGPQVCFPQSVGAVCICYVQC